MKLKTFAVFGVFKDRVDLRGAMEKLNAGSILVSVSIRNDQEGAIASELLSDGGAQDVALLPEKETWDSISKDELTKLKTASAEALDVLCIS